MELGQSIQKKHLFICEIIWTMKNIEDDDAKIAQLEMTFKDHALLWYMKYHTMTPLGQTRTLVMVRQVILKELKKPKYEL
jgi:hypothetical protein